MTDQPTTEPSVERVKAAARTLNLNGWTCDGGSDEPGNYDECEDCQRCCDALARAALRSAAAVAPAPQPAADTEVQWGVRREDGSVAPWGANKPSQDYLDRYHRPGLVPVRRTATYTPWEEA